MTDDPHCNREDNPSARPAASSTEGRRHSPKVRIASPVRTVKTDDTGPETQPRWSPAVAPSNNWGSLNLTGAVELPPAGDYDALVANIDIIDKGDVLWLIVSFTLVGEEASPAPQLGMLDSRNMAQDQHRVSEGRRLLNKLLTATRTPPETVENPFDLPALFTGKPVRLTLHHKSRDGVTELAIRSIRPRM